MTNIVKMYTLYEDIHRNNFYALFYQFADRCQTLTMYIAIMNAY